MTRKNFLKSSAWAAFGTAAIQPQLANATPSIEPFFLTRGIVLTSKDLEGMDWPAMAQQARLTTIAMHGGGGPKNFPAACAQHGLQLEYELHAVNYLLPRNLFAKDPTMFRMDEHGRRQQGGNLCVHSEQAVQIVCHNALQWAKDMRSGTGRYFYWTDDGQIMCRCEKCRDFSDSEQALLLENQVLTALRREIPNATLAHLAYFRTLPAPVKVKPLPGVFLEFAPYTRQYDRPLSDRQAPGINPGPNQLALGHAALLDLLDANLEVFGRADAQMLEYWLDLSRFNRIRPEADRSAPIKLPWHQDVFEDDVKTYAKRGIRHLTSFGVMLRSAYVKQFGLPPIQQYGDAMRRWRLVDGKPVMV